MLEADRLSASICFVSALADSGRRQNGPPVGYIRGKLYNRSLLVRILIDSGNLFSDLMSEKLFKLLHVTMEGPIREVGTASKAGTVTVLGRTKPFRLFLEGIAGSVVVQPYVVRDLAHHLNLGQDFLRSNNAEMSFNATGIQLRINGSATKLTTSAASLTRPTIDSRLKVVLDRLKEDGDNPALSNEGILDLRVSQVTEPGSGPQSPVVLAHTVHRLYTVGPVTIQAGQTVPVQVTQLRADKHVKLHPQTVNTVYVVPRPDNEYLNENEILVHPGLYTRDAGSVTILASNLGDHTVDLPRGLRIGHSMEAVEEVERVQTLDHRPQAQGSLLILSS